MFSLSVLESVQLSAESETAFREEFRISPINDGSVMLGCLAHLPNDCFLFWTLATYPVVSMMIERYHLNTPDGVRNIVRLFLAKWMNAQVGR